MNMAENETPQAVEATEVKEEVAAQVAPARDPEKDTVEVHEVSVRTDYVVTDPSSDLAVQVPEAEERKLPIHAVVNAPSAEEVFAGEEPKEGQPVNPEVASEDRTSGDPAPADDSDES